MGLIQRQAGVDSEISELVCAYARLKSNRNEEVQIYRENVTLDDVSKHVTLKWFLERNPQADPRFVDFLAAYSAQFSSRKLPVIFSVNHLAYKWGTTPSRLKWIACHQREFYRSFSIPKANGKSRDILAPDDQILTMQRWIFRRILNQGKPHKFATAFIRGQSILNNARPHLGRKVVVRLDIKDFFPSITHRQVRKVFEKFGYPYRVAVLLANICTVDGRLPQGAPTSPMLSNLVCQKMDKRFAWLRHDVKFRYSRYADDMIFSSDNDKFPSIIPFLKQIVREEGFEPNEDKIKIMRRGQRQTVTGVVVNEQLNLSRKHVRKLRAAVDRHFKAGPESVEMVSRCPGEHDPLNVLKGHISFLNMVRPDRAALLTSKLGG